MEDVRLVAGGHLCEMLNPQRRTSFELAGTCSRNSRPHLLYFLVRLRATGPIIRRLGPCFHDKGGARGNDTQGVAGLSAVDRVENVQLARFRLSATTSGQLSANHLASRRGDAIIRRSRSRGHYLCYHGSMDQAIPPACRTTTMCACHARLSIEYRILIDRGCLPVKASACAVCGRPWQPESSQTLPVLDSLTSQHQPYGFLALQRQRYMSRRIRTKISTPRDLFTWDILLGFRCESALSSLPCRVGMGNVPRVAALLHYSHCLNVSLDYARHSVRSSLIWPVVSMYPRSYTCRRTLSPCFGAISRVPGERLGSDLRKMSCERIESSKSFVRIVHLRSHPGSAASQAVDGDMLPDIACKEHFAMRRTTEEGRYPTHRCREEPVATILGYSLDISRRSPPESRAQNIKTLKV
ncbi:hypothetical protein K491DRAFT_190646 [Lophiostoma macrostomum CBS 122681]|uniref:Uncharacterized protein n=1 Tax=Lophiostoma macrostomum CBS 122681 TaxID=1314788 RepID=A0A6A6TU39_9PLEO|nr:hypothetical protein K491DRAFT_190646 [Lophiostoma macrostomum CBS 122681]